MGTMMNEKSSWRIFFHPAFEKQLSSLTAKVELLKKSTKILAAIRQIIITLSEDPTQPIFRQGKTLGDQYLNWHRAKFFQQYRLFFRFQTSAKIVVIGWVNDDSTLRAYESKNDAYKVFARMLDNGNPPSNWDELLSASHECDFEL
jgi:toxin YhaV